LNARILNFIRIEITSATEINPEKIGLYATGATVAGIAGHAALTAVKKSKDEKNSSKES